MKYAARFKDNETGFGIPGAKKVIIHATNGVIERTYPRPLYTMTEAADTAQWLNERAKGYPRNRKLDHLYNGRG